MICGGIMQLIVRDGILNRWCHFCHKVGHIMHIEDSCCVRCICSENICINIPSFVKEKNNKIINSVLISTKISYDVVAYIIMPMAAFMHDKCDKHRVE